MFHEACSAFYPLLLSLPVFALPTAISYPQREGSDKLSSAVIGQLADDGADGHRADRQEKMLLHIKPKVHPHTALPALCTLSSPT